MLTINKKDILIEQQQQLELHHFTKMLNNSPVMNMNDFAAQYLAERNPAAVISS
jgi:hypothetical protein